MLPEHWRRSALRMVGMEPAPIRSLADETPEASATPKWSPLSDAEAAGRWQPRTDDDPSVITVYLDNSAARFRPTADLHAVDDHRSLEDRYLAVCERLREVTADRDRLDAANGRLIDRVHGLEETVRAYAGHTCDTAVMPRVRSHPAPGLAIDVTRPGDEDELYIRPLAGQ